MHEIGNLVRSRSSSLHSTVFMRDMRELAACVFIILVFVPAVFWIPGILVKIGVGIIVLGAIGIIALMSWVRGLDRADSSALPLKDFIANEIRYLDRQITMLRYIAWWYLLPTGIGVCLFVVGMDHSKADGFAIGDYLFSICFCIAYFFFCVFIWWLNQKGVRTQFQPRRDVMQRTYDSLAAMEEPDPETELISALSNPELHIGDPQFGGITPTKTIWALVAVALLAVGITIAGASWAAVSVIREWNRDSQIAMIDFKSANTVEDLAWPLIESGQFQAFSIGVVSLDSRGQLQSKSHHFGDIEFAVATDKGSSTPDDQTFYEVGGISNLFTGLLLATAVERGEVSLDTTLMEIVPREVKLPSHPDGEITLLDVMTHRSGLPRLADNMPLSLFGASDPYKNYTAELAEAFLAGHELKDAPGSTYRYSNFAPAYLGHVLTKVAGEKSYDALLANRIGKPLGLTHTQSVIDDEESLLPLGYTKRSRWSPFVDPRYELLHGSMDRAAER